jgi:hypothetical protein
VPGKASRVIELDSAEDESPALDEFVGVGAETDSHRSPSVQVVLSGREKQASQGRREHS